SFLGSTFALGFLITILSPSLFHPKPSFSAKDSHVKFSSPPAHPSTIHLTSTLRYVLATDFKARLRTPSAAQSITARVYPSTSFRSLQNVTQRSWTKAERT